jgi:hypothetical protein
VGQRAAATSFFVNMKPVSLIRPVLSQAPMPYNGHHPLTAPPELTSEEVREMGYRAIVGCFEAQAKSYDLIAKSRHLLSLVDELLARDRLPQLAPH